MEQGDYNPSASLALRVAALFDLPVEQLFSLPPAAKAELEAQRRRILKTRSNGDL
jgi:DNA-binding XRE family transcriptional regulator